MAVNIADWPTRHLKRCPLPGPVACHDAREGEHMFALTEEQQAVCSSMRRFAQRELRWRARKLDSAPPGTIDWELMRKSCDFGLLSAQLPPHYGGTMDRLS